ncbi:(S)-benzoin forming benzil reductase [Falsibacillus pallidus]|uniref:Benzil reductase ((S)-benzoin forming) n=1 Tax=Falsibacillus pallidus TaxID=493781 RepID=A0A370GE59_9BACI|nr:(S)-benzoin forming benzil reductase [Falsibacillus pallidus]RDI41389.1 benzil reductase ((S)-benzoin forming) [Falsibacillus pallidus]
MKTAVITGASRGLGFGIAKNMLEEGIGVITISRNENIEIKELANKNGLSYNHFQCDLSSEKDVVETFGKAASIAFSSGIEKVYLFNNAGTVEPIETVGSLPVEEVGFSVQTNLIAPILISNIFLHHSKESKIPADIVNVSSGAGEKPYQGWSVYCSTKAGLNMFTKTAALEQEQAGTNNKIIAYSPGIMDTNMQGTIRSSSQEAFHDIDRFKKFKENGDLRHPDVVAGAIVNLLLHGEVKSGEIYHVNDLI